MQSHLESAGIVALSLGRTHTHITHVFPSHTIAHTHLWSVVRVFSFVFLWLQHTFQCASLQPKPVCSPNNTAWTVSASPVWTPPLVTVVWGGGGLSRLPSLDFNDTNEAAVSFSPFHLPRLAPWSEFGEGGGSRPLAFSSNPYWPSRPLMDLDFPEPFPLCLVVGLSPSSSASPENKNSRGEFMKRCNDLIPDTRGQTFTGRVAD